MTDSRKKCHVLYDTWPQSDFRGANVIAPCHHHVPHQYLNTIRDISLSVRSDAEKGGYQIIIRTDRLVYFFLWKACEGPEQRNQSIDVSWRIHHQGATDIRGACVILVPVSERFANPYKYTRFSKKMPGRKVWQHSTQLNRNASVHIMVEIQHVYLFSHKGAKTIHPL